MRIAAANESLEQVFHSRMQWAVVAVEALVPNTYELLEVVLAGWLTVTTKTSATTRPIRPVITGQAPDLRVYVPSLLTSAQLPLSDFRQEKKGLYRAVSYLMRRRMRNGSNWSLLS